MLREEFTHTFSDIWYRVGPTRPRLSPHAQVTRQSFGDHTVYIVEDPAAGQYYRLTEAAYFFLGLLDGRRDVQSAWDACNEQLGDDAPTQRECVELLSRLQRFGLILGDRPLAPDMVRERLRETARARLRRRTGRLFAITLPLINPEPWLERLAPLLRAVFSWWGAAVWLLVVGSGLIAVFAHAGELSSGFNALLDPANLVWMTLLFVLLRAWHELGHAAACKAMGGRCTQMGLLLILLVLPLPYCDASSAWRFPEIWRRVLVSAAGMIVELFVAGIAALLWAFGEPGLVKSLAFNTMLLCGVTTLVFNANPLLRYDGYYILSDLTGTPNLAQRSTELARYLIERRAFGIRAVRPPPVRGRAEFWLMAVYAALAFPYRIFITVSIILLVSSRYLTLGTVLAVAAAAAWLVWPVLKGLAYLAAEPRLIGRRGRAVGVVAATLAGLGILLGVVPFPAAGYGSGTVEPSVKVPVRAEEDGFVSAIHARIGEHVNRGALIAELTNVEVIAERDSAAARRRQAAAELDEASLRGPAHTEIARRALEKAVADLARAERRVESLAVRAPESGLLMPVEGTAIDLENAVGRFVSRGALVAQVGSADVLEIRSIISDLDHAYVFREGVGAGDVGASFKLRGLAGEQAEGEVLRVAPAATRTVASEALSTMAGGDIAIDPTDPQRARTLHPQFVVVVRPTAVLPTMRPGQWARVRLTAPAEPLLVQAWRRALQYFSIRRAT